MDKEEIEKTDYENYHPKGIEMLFKAHLNHEPIYENYEQYNHSNILTIEKTIYNYFVLLKNGILLSIFENKTNTLGRYIKKDSQLDQTIGKVQILEKIIDVRCGEKHVLALTICGKIYVWGENDCGQDIKVVSILAFENTSYAIAEPNVVYHWGKFTIQDFDNYVNTEITSIFTKKIKKEIITMLSQNQDFNRIPTLLPVDTKNFINLLIIPRRHGKNQIFLANVNQMEKNLSSILEVAKTSSRPKNNIDVQPQNRSSSQEVNSRVEELESKIIKFINFIKKDASEKENQQNLLKHYQAKYKDFNDDNREEKNINKKTFDEKFAEISQMPNKIKAEFDIEIPNHDNLYLLVKSAKDDLRSAYNNKNEKSEAQEKYKLAGENFKKLDGKIRSFIEILKKTINILEIDKRTLLEEELKMVISKIDEEIPILELKFLNNIEAQAKILSETSSSFQAAKGKSNICSLSKLLDQIVLFVDEVKKKVFDLKNSQMHSSLKFALEKLNAESTESFFKLEDIGFLNFQKSDEVINNFNLFILTLKQNAILLSKILKISEAFYSKTLEKIFEKKLDKVSHRSKSEIIYRKKFGKDRRQRSVNNFSIKKSTQQERDKDEATPGNEIN